MLARIWLSVNPASATVSEPLFPFDLLTPPVFWLAVPPQAATNTASIAVRVTAKTRLCATASTRLLCPAPDGARVPAGPRPLQ